MTVQGMDVSEWQSVIDWQMVAESKLVQFAFIKATDGANWMDPYFYVNAKRARLAGGIALGFYAYGRPSENTGKQDAEMFLDALAAIGGLMPGEMPALDLEDSAVPTGSDLAAYTLDFLHTVEERVGFKPLLYSNPSYLSGHRCTDNTELGQYGLWLASWQKTMPDPPPGWDFIAFWQNGSSVNVPGIAESVDADVFNGSADRMRLYGKP